MIGINHVFCHANIVKVFSVAFFQPSVSPLDEYGALIYAGRWGIHGITLPGRVTFAPGNVGFATFGAPRPMNVSGMTTTNLYCLTSYYICFILIG